MSNIVKNLSSLDSIVQIESVESEQVRPSSREEIEVLKEKAREEAAALPEFEKEFAALQAEHAQLSAMPEAKSSLTVQKRLEKIAERMDELQMRFPDTLSLTRATGIGDFRALMSLANEMAKTVRALEADKKPNGQKLYEAVGPYNRVLEMGIKCGNVEKNPLSSEEVKKRKDTHTLHAVPYKGGLHGVPSWKKPAVAGFIQLVWTARKSIERYEQSLRKYREERVKNSTISPSTILRKGDTSDYAAFWFEWDERGQKRRRYLDVETDGDRLYVVDATGFFVRFIEPEGFPHESVPAALYKALKIADDKGKWGVRLITR